MQKTINLNADMGESYGAYTLGKDATMLDIVTSANIACGYHAGDPSVMLETVRLATAKGVSIGAHPAYPDLQGFGRRPLQMAHDDITAMVMYQIGALMGIAASLNVAVSHVKPHGALNNMACKDAGIAQAIARAVHAISPRLILLAPTGSQLYHAGITKNLHTAGEIFADRAYDDEGNLVPRSQPGAVIHDPAQCAAHVLALLDQGLPGQDAGANATSSIHSVCVHGDTEDAVRISQRVRDVLVAHGYAIQPLPQVLSL